MLVPSGFTIQQLIKEERLTLEDITTLQIWVQENRNQIPDLTAEQIAVFLLACSNDLDYTKEALIAHYKIKREYPEIFSDRNVLRKELEAAANVIQLTALPEKTPDGYNVFVVRVSDPVYYNMEMGPVLKLVGMGIDSLIHNYPPRGIILLYDMEMVGIMHLMRFELRLMIAVIQLIRGGPNARVMRMEILNSGYFMTSVMGLLSPIMSAEILDLFHFHPPGMNMEDFHNNCIPKQCLPADYGGDLPAIQLLHEEYMKKLASLQNYFDAEESQRNSQNPVIT